MQAVPGGVRLVAYYEAFGRASSMVFYFRSYEAHPPTVADGKAVADAYGIWEFDGFLSGYVDVRSDDSHYVNVRCTSIDPLSSVTFRDATFDRTGQIPGFLSPMLPTGLAPLCRWGTAERGPATGRSYLVGVSEGVTGMGSDQSYLGPGAGAAIQVYMDNLRAVVLAATGFTQCHFTASQRGGLPIGQHLLDITDCGVYNLVGSRRLRTRPG